MEHFPQTRDKYESFRKFAHLQKEYPWAKGIVIVSFWYGKYRIPDHVLRNALNAMLNHYEPQYLPVIQKACFDEYAEVRDMAKWILEILENENIN